MSTTPRHAFLLGFRRTLPFQWGVVPFGILYATLATTAGFPWWLTLFFSIAVFGGSSQLVFIDLLQYLSSPFQAVLGSNIVNARHMIYSAGVSRKFAGFSRHWKWLLSYLLTDQLYAISQEDPENSNEFPPSLAPWFYFGSGFCTWIFWLISCGLGITSGRFIPASWNLGFSIPLMFMPLIFSVSKTKYAYITCLFAFGFVYFLQGLPFGLGVFFAILLASILGFLVQRYWEAQK